MVPTGMRLWTTWLDNQAVVAYLLGGEGACPSLSTHLGRCEEWGALLAWSLAHRLLKCYVARK